MPSWRCLKTVAGVMSKAPSKANLRRKADKLWFQRLLKPSCELCGGRAVQVHHFFPKGQFGHLRYDLENGISLCMGCHFRLHHQDPTTQQDIIKARGIEWYETLKGKSRLTPNSYQKISFYKNVIEKLNI